MDLTDKIAMGKACRFCSDETVQLFNIDKKVETVINELSEIKCAMEYINRNANRICLNCSDNLRVAYKVKQQVDVSNMNMLGYCFKNNSFSLNNSEAKISSNENAYISVTPSSESPLLSDITEIPMLEINNINYSIGRSTNTVESENIQNVLKVNIHTKSIIQEDSSTNEIDKKPRILNNIQKVNKPVIYQFRIDLGRYKPPIWRRIQVPSTYTFWDLHVAIVNIMDWSDIPLHQFKMKNPISDQTDIITNQLHPQFINNKPESTTLIAKYFTLERRRGIYEYNMEPIQCHKILFEKMFTCRRSIKYPICTNGKRFAPPEDRIFDNDLQIWNSQFDSTKVFDPHSIQFEDPRKRYNCPQNIRSA